MMTEKFNKLIKEKDLYKKFIYNPTLYDIQSLLREEYNIHIYIRINNNEWSIYVEEIPSGVDITPYELVIKDFNSYTEALEKGLLIMLNYI